MTKEVIAVFQDCVLCGDRGRKKIQKFAEKGISIRKLSAFSDEGGKLCHEAVFEHKMGSLPFFTDGKKFSYKLKDFIEKPKKERKTKKNKGLKKDEPV